MYYSVLPEWNWISIRGKNNKLFLQNLITNDINKVNNNNGIFSLLLNAQGRILFDLFIYQENDLTIWINTDRPEELFDLLSYYNIRNSVNIMNHSLELDTLILWGNNDSDYLIKSGEVKYKYPSLYLFADPRFLVGGGIRIKISKSLLESTDLEKELLEFNLEKKPFSFWDAHRIRFGLPNGIKDIIPSKSLPLEFGYQDLNAISWSKGCYIGQELTARTYYRGLIRKKIVPVMIESTKNSKFPIPFKTKVLQSGEEIGDMRSNCHNVGLVFIRLNSISCESDITCMGLKISPRKPSWWLI